MAKMSDYDSLSLCNFFIKTMQRCNTSNEKPSRMYLKK